MTPKLQILLEQLPDLLGGHLTLAVPAIFIGVLISVPLGILCVKSATIRGPVMSLVSLVQTIPSIALLAIMVALLGGTIGYWPAFIALLVYSILPIIRNTIVGLESVDPAMREAAKAVGMRPLQQLLWVELPLALPVILAGIRTATVWVVGIATLSTPVGAPSLGNYIFSGLQLRDWQRVIFGCIATMTLSLVLDQLIAVIEKSIQSRRRVSLVLATCVLAGLVGIGLAPSLVAPDSAGFANLLGMREGVTESDELVESPMTLDGQVIRIGAKGFTEQFILVEVLRERIQKAGGTPEVLTNMGSTIVFDALAKDSIDIYIDYTGTLWSTVLKEPDPINRISMRAAVAGRLFNEFGIVLVGSLGFENTYALVTKRKTVARYGLTQIGDITPVAKDLRIGGDPEFFGRPEWQRVRQLYSLGDITEVGMDSTFMYQAVADGQVDVAAGFSTDGRIDAFDLAVLNDPKQAFPPYDAVILLSPRAAKNKNLVHAIEPLLNRIPVTAMRTANRLVDEGGETPKEAARQLFLD
ncbi:ABC transporter permease/substrate-binding protein [Pirellulales bacterium]|jgi:osmoprotectant transport system permease protein|nr:ABC transporter permease/substrate-binding protein [Pirellulales bacterium]MDB4358311.1 ABC transporter permease/substrate-binding protein [bacterium]